jgi:hypothetical protein
LSLAPLGWDGMQGRRFPAGLVRVPEGRRPVDL